MLKQLFISSMILTLSATAAYASVSYKGENRYQTRHHYKGYKGELPPPIKQPPLNPPPLEPMPCRTDTFNSGPYIGLNPGIRTNYTQNSAVYKGFEATLFAGYAFVSSDFYLAPEIFVQHGGELQNYSQAVNANGNPISLQTTWGFGFNLIPGYIIADTIMIYLRGGVVETHFQDVAKTILGGQTGIGVQGVVAENWDLRCEYVYSFYQQAQGLGNPRTDTYRLGLVYKL